MYAECGPFLQPPTIPPFLRLQPCLESLGSHCSSAEFGQNEVGKQLNSVPDLYLERVKHIECICELHKCSFVEEYRNGNLSLLFEVPTEWNVDVVRRLFMRTPCESVFNFPLFIFHLDALNGRVFKNGQEKTVFVVNVQAMDRPDGAIPSLVRLYIANNKIEKAGNGGVYFNPAKRTFKQILARKNGKLSVFRNSTRGKPLECAGPCMIESAMEIMDGIADYQSNIFEEFVPIAKIMLQHFMSTVRVYLDSGGVSLWQRGDNRLQFGDVLLGSLNFASGAGERV
jgi:hypothetical protein